MPLPAKEGVTEKVLDPQDGLPYHMLRLSKATSLKDLSGDYSFFTLALLYTHGEWTSDPLQDYVRTHPKCTPFVITLPRPAFSGLSLPSDDSWNYKVFGCYQEDWPDLFNFLGSLGGVDYHKKRYHRMLAQRLPLIDLLALERLSCLPSPLPTVDLISFGIDGNRHKVGLEPAKHPPLDRITVISLPPDEQTIRLARAVLARQEKPFRAIQPGITEAYAQLLDNVSQGRKEPVPESNNGIEDPPSKAD
jgi:hypothetical protein